MKLAAKLILVFMIGVLGIVSLFSWQTIRRQLRWEEMRHADHADDVVGALRPMIEDAYRNGGVVTIQHAIEVSAQSIPGQQVRWVDGVALRDARATVTSRNISSISIADRDGTTVTQTLIPLTIDGVDAGGVEVSQSMRTSDRFIRESMLASVYSLLGVAALSGIVIYFGGVRLVGKPLEKLIQQVRDIGDGQLPQPPILKRNDELGSLSEAISQMSVRIDQQQNTIRHTDRLGTVGTLAAGMAHEMGTPLNVVAGRANLIASGKLSPEEVVNSALTIKSEAERMTKIIRQLLDFARQPSVTGTVVDVAEIAVKTCSLLEPLAEKSSVKIDLKCGQQGCQIKGDATLIQQVLTNLLTNAIQAMPDGGLVSVEVAPQSDTSHHFVCIRVTDQGKGIEPDQVSHVFEPFFTTKDVGQGTGLGLSIAYGIVKEHGGTIEVESGLDLPTTFCVQLPAAEQSP